LESGRLRRNKYTNQQPVFSTKNQEFPPLGEPRKLRQSAWNHVQPEKHTNKTSDSTKALLLINENLVAMRKSSKRVEETLERDRLQTESNSIKYRITSNNNGQIDRICKITYSKYYWADDVSIKSVNTEL